MIDNYGRYDRRRGGAIEMTSHVDLLNVLCIGKDFKSNKTNREEKRR